MPRSATTVPDRLAEVYRRLGVRGEVVLAVSGGADSMALLRGTLAVARDVGLTAAVAHLDHGLRGESASDAEWVASCSEQVGVPCVVGRRPVAEVVAATSRGIEEAARSVRYEFLTGVADDRGARFVATAHTADDQAETVLFQMLRGSGLRGLRGMPARRRLSDNVTLVRPLLGVSRAEVEAYLASLGQPFLTDASNADLSYARNRLRHDVLPRLREAIHPRVDEALVRLSRQADEVASLLRGLARRELRHAAVELTDETIRLNCVRLRRRPRALVRETVALAWRRAGWPRQAMGFEHWDALAGIVRDGGRRTLPGRTDARRRRGELILRRGGG